MNKTLEKQNITPSWVFFTVIFFLLSISITSVGIFYCPVDVWIKGYLAMGLFSCIASAIIITKTQRDLFEAKKVNNDI